MKKRGRIPMDKSLKKVNFPTKLTPSLIKRIEKKAKKEHRSRNNLVEMTLENSI